MNDVELSRVAADCLEIGTRAAAVANTGFGRRVAASTKGKNDLVTEFDLRSQVLAISALEERYPGVPIVGEEGSRARLDGDWAERDLAFAVDPIDGTTNFAHGHPFWCVSIGALSRGKPIAGAIVAPALSAAWHGWFRTPEARAVYKNGEPRSVSDTTELTQAFVATGFPPNRELAPDNNFDTFAAVKRRVQAVRRCGSAALDFAFVADGTYDAYWERRIMLWDAAAGAALVLAAGGRLTTIGGGPVRLERGNLVASNGHIHEALERVITG
ncbi:MAG: inositol monophosphatase family protein [Polyangiaceae bacterium]